MQDLHLTLGLALHSHLTTCVCENALGIIWAFLVTLGNGTLLAGVLHFSLHCLLGNIPGY